MMHKPTVTIIDWSRRCGPHDEDEQEQVQVQSRSVSVDQTELQDEGGPQPGP